MHNVQSYWNRDSGGETGFVKGFNNVYFRSRVCLVI